MNLTKGQKIYKGQSALTVISVSKSGLTAVLETANKTQRLMRMDTIDRDCSSTKPAKK